MVRPVSKLAKYAYAQVWIPLSSTSAFIATWGDDNIMGMTAVYILAKSKDDFPAIRQEADRLRAIFMAGHPNFDLLYRGPVSYTHLDVYKRQGMVLFHLRSVYAYDCLCP